MKKICATEGCNVEIDAVRNRKYCEDCSRKLKKKYVRKYRKNNLEKARELNKKWRKNNPEKVRKSNKKWRENNPEKARE